MAQGRSRRCDTSSGVGAAIRHRRGSVMLNLPRFVIHKKLKTTSDSFYFNVPTIYVALGCTVRNEPLGTDYGLAIQRAAILNELFDEWNASRKGSPVHNLSKPRIGTVDWLFVEYRRSKAYTEKVAARSRPNYEWAMRELSNIITKKGDRIGSRAIRSITPLGADKIYEILTMGEKGERL